MLVLEWRVFQRGVTLFLPQTSHAHPQRDGLTRSFVAGAGIIDGALGRRRVDEPLLVHSRSKVWWQAQTRVWERQFMRQRLGEHLATAARVIASAEAAEADARIAAMAAAAAAAAATESLVRATVVAAAAQPVALLGAPVLLTEAVASAVAAAAQPVALLGAPVLLTEAVASAPPVELPPAWRVWPLPPSLTLQLMEDWLASDRGWLSLALVCHALAFKDGRAQELREAAARDDAARQWVAIRAMRVKRLLTVFWPRGACYQTTPPPPLLAPPILLSL